MKYTESGQLEIGDVVITETFIGKSYFTIDRVGKTFGSSKNKNGYNHKFQREISHNMSYPHERWNTVDYKVVKKEDWEKIEQSKEK